MGLTLEDRMTKTIEAVYEEGILRPLESLNGFAEHERVRVRVETTKQTVHPLAACVGILEDADAREMSQAIEDEFEKVDRREWR